MNKEVYNTIKNRRSVRDYSSKVIPNEVLERLYDSLRFAPSACNFQPWEFIFVFNPNIKKELARAANNQTSIAAAHLIVVACGYPERAYKKMGGYGNSVDIDIAIALDHLSLLATSEGLGTCWIGAFKENEIKKLLKLPDNVKVVAMMSVGYPKSPDLIYPISENQRKTKSEIFRNYN